MEFELDEIKKRIAEGRPYVIRFRSPGDESRYFSCFDEIRGDVSMPENIMKLVMRNVREDCVVVIDTLENMNGTL